MKAVRHLAWSVLGLTTAVYVLVALTVWQSTRHSQLDFDGLEAKTSEDWYAGIQNGQDLLEHSADSNSNSTGTTSQTTLYVITPTFQRPTQRPDLTRLAQTLASVPNLHWILIEDSTQDSPTWISELLQRLSIEHTVLGCRARPQQQRQRQLYRKKGKVVARGAVQRNCGLGWIHQQGITDGVIYFADDDNAYDLRVFEEMRKARTVAMVPTGNMADSGVSSPLLEDGVVVDWIDPWPVARRFKTDMASFAVNIQFWHQRGSPILCDTLGLLETRLLTDMKVQYSELELTAGKCTQILVWHTQTEWTDGPNATYWQGKLMQYPEANLQSLFNKFQPQRGH